MLSRKVAEERLEEFKIEEWEEQRLAAVGKLPAKLAAIGRILFERDAQGKKFRSWEKELKATEAASKEYNALSSKERLRLFTALFPKLAEHLEGAWQLHQRLPYEVDYDRKGFRAPHDETIQRKARWNSLKALVSELEGYDEDVTWLAAWAPHLGASPDAIGLVLAAAIDAGGAEGDEVFQILKDSASREHEIGSMGRHVTRGLLVASRPDGWKFIEKLLLAAQRQEGLRQVILETIDEAHPDAFRRMLRLILDENLVRFSSVIRAADVWFGLQWSALTPAKIKVSIEQVLEYLTKAKKRDAALKSAKGEALYLALWTLGFEDATAAVKPAAALLKDKDAERRFVAVQFLGQLGLPAAQVALIPALDDADLRVAVRTFDLLSHVNEDDEDAAPDSEQFEVLERLFERLPGKTTRLDPPTFWPWIQLRANPKEVADRLGETLGKRPVTTLLPYLTSMNDYGRANLVERLAKLKKWSPELRETLFALAGDRSEYVRRQTLEALNKVQATEDDVQILEGTLTRINPELRRGVLGLLQRQKLDVVLGSAERLLDASNKNQRQAGLELLHTLIDEAKGVTECRALAEQFQADHPELSLQEQNELRIVLDPNYVKPTLENGLGLFDPKDRSPRIPPQPKDVQFFTDATILLIQSLNEVIEEHGETTITVETWQGKEDKLLAEVGWEFPGPNDEKPLAEDVARLPLRDVWEKWWTDRPQNLRDSDGLELVRASIWLSTDEYDVEMAQDAVEANKELQPVLEGIWGDRKPLELLEKSGMVQRILEWLQRLHPPTGKVDFLLDAAEAACALVPEKEVRRLAEKKKPDEDEDQEDEEIDWRSFDPIVQWLGQLNQAWDTEGKPWSPAQKERHWRLLHWLDEPVPGARRERPSLDVLIAAYEARQATLADVVDDLIGPHEGDYGLHFGTLQLLTGARVLPPVSPPPQPSPTRGEGEKPILPPTKDDMEWVNFLQRHPEIATLVERARERVLEIELSRGDLPTPATNAARSLSCVWGLNWLLRLLTGLGTKGFKRGYGDSRATVLTDLVEKCRPLTTDTPAEFASAVKAALEAEAFPPERLQQLIFVNPRWLPYVKEHFGWPGLDEAAWWFLTHLNWTDEDEVSEDEEEGRPRQMTAWEKLIAERTPLTAQERQDGAVDADWFQRVYAGLGEERWDELAEASKFGGHGQDYRKVVLLADVLRGEAKKTELVADIRQKMRKNAVRLLGLLPLAEGDKREADILQRYQVLQHYARYARGLSPMAKPDAMRAAEVGIENLARTAGYPDPLRFEWAMERESLADLAEGPLEVTVKGVTATLSLDPLGLPELAIDRDGKSLKALPKEVKKNPKLVALSERRTELKRQASRMRQSLEALMIRGDTITGTELRTLFEHPLLSRLLSRLVLVGEGIRGYPVSDGKGLRDFSDRIEPVKADERLRIAHPLDLLGQPATSLAPGLPGVDAGPRASPGLMEEKTGDWPSWQEDCLRRETIQPFKQLFREVYLPTSQELQDGTFSTRYAGHQVNEMQALALFGTRGWNTRDGVNKTFYAAGLVVEVSFKSGVGTPLEVEGLTLDAVRFYQRGEWKPVTLKDVPPRLFSEVMRDLDLVVSVAHVGGVDPEASASTVEMRASLLQATCGLLNISNFRVQGNHIVIDGRLNKYSLHLGSGQVHKLPGGAVCIIPVHAQHRGRLFLPFADDDPRTAEVLSKVLLLAKDDEIQDPNILDQLR